MRLRRPFRSGVRDGAAGLARLLTRLASFSRPILFDKRGTGLSDRVSDMPSLEVRMDDVRAVMDAVGSQRAALFGYLAFAEQMERETGADR